MSDTSYKNGSILFVKGQPAGNCSLLLEGTVTLTIGKKAVLLGAGDVIGLAELYYGTFYEYYIATSDVKIRPLANLTTDQLVLFLEEHTEYLPIFTASILRQMAQITEAYQRRFIECSTLFRYIAVTVRNYRDLCQKHSLPIKDLSFMEDFSAPSSQTQSPKWFVDFYPAMLKMDSNLLQQFLTSNKEVVLGFLCNSLEDYAAIMTKLSRLEDYLAEISPLLLNDTNIDIYDLLTNLACTQKQFPPIFDTLEDMIVELSYQIQANDYLTEELFALRSKQYYSMLESSHCNASSQNEDESDSTLDVLLKDSLNTLLDYTGYPKTQADRLRNYIAVYRSTMDKSSHEDPIRLLRKELSAHFYEIYSLAFYKSLQETQLSPIVRMFLHFGYLDSSVSGMRSARYLAKLDVTLDDPNAGIYTYYSWLKAIYEGKKDPSRNEFELDYTDWLREQRQNGKLSPDEEARLLRDPKGRVDFEIQNIFPSVSKITYGRPSVFCPLLSEHNLYKEIDSMLTSYKGLQETIKLLQSIDYSLFYRETNMSDNAGLGKYYYHTEILPDIILVPTIGTRGIMWQEIEGKRRNTPARMMLPILSTENISQILIKLSGEFRWEMCKRIQGARWNNVSEPSLTSEYADYLQFYKRNTELSSDAKEKLQLALSKTRNNYKELFVADYYTWITYEGIGAPRLNKVARRILFQYCPFSKSIRSKLAANPLYKDYLDKYEIKQAQKLKVLDNITKKFSNAGMQIPEELQGEIAMWNL